MKHLYKGLFGFFILASVFAVPGLGSAQVINGGGTNGVNGGGTNTVSGGGTNNVNGGGACGSSSNGFTLCNPLGSTTSFCGLLKTIFGDLLILGIPIATLFIVFAGFQLVAARGSEEKLRKAKNNLLYIVIGIALFLGAWTLAQIIAATLAQLGAGGGLC